MIHVENLVKRYGSNAAVDGVSFDVAAGEVVGLLGPNGAGKSTTMRILTGAMPPTDGIAEVAGHDVVEAPLDVKSRVGYLPEVPPLYPEMKVRSFLKFVAELKGVPRRDRKARVESALSRCWLEERADQPIEQLSKGYKQRVGLAQAILHDPELLILDEPTSGLDPRQIIEVRQLIRDLAGDHTVVLSSHILSEISASVQRVVVINEGKVVAADSVDELSRRFGGGDQVTVQVRGDADALRRMLPSLPGVADARIVEDVESDVWRCDLSAAPDTDVRPRVAAAVVNAGFELIGMTRREMGLEEIFLRLTDEVNQDADAEDQAA
ncbi:MAG: ATP-binding cassette domain-containing protein [Acidobacteria bacterium]|nr:ATP-binding cassette domain-containing protein [Acidobacteriota bacterium]